MPCQLVSASWCGDAVEAAYAGALTQLSEALTAATAPVNQLTASLTSQIAVRPHTLCLQQAVLPSLYFNPFEQTKSANGHSITTVSCFSKLGCIEYASH